MADFPPNLDDGELWLPSEIILDVGGVTCRPNRRYPPPPSLPVEAPPAGFARVDDLAYQLVAAGVLDHTYVLQSSTVAVAPLKPSSKPSSDLQGLNGGRPASCFEPPPIAGAVYGGLRPSANKAVPGAGEAGVGAIPYGLAKPVRVQASQRLPKPVRGRIVPVRMGAGVGRERGGTGVFLPRVSNAPSNNSNGEAKKKFYGKGGEGMQQLHYTKSSVAVWKKQQQQQGMPFQNTAEIGLPQEWTY